MVRYVITVSHQGLSSMFRHLIGILGVTSLLFKLLPSLAQAVLPGQGFIPSSFPAPFSRFPIHTSMMRLCPLLTVSCPPASISPDRDPQIYACLSATLFRTFSRPRK
jgi:hypothetical protein